MDEQTIEARDATVDVSVSSEREVHLSLRVRGARVYAFLTPAEAKQVAESLVGIADAARAEAVIA